MLRPAVTRALLGHGVTIGENDTPATLRARLNEVYLIEVRALKARQQGGEIPIKEYATHAFMLKSRFPLLGLPLEHWEG